MLISMPTGTSTIFGVFQLIRVSPKQCWHDIRAGTKTRLTSNIAQARNIRCRRHTDASDAGNFPLGQSYFALGQGERMKATDRCMSHVGHGSRIRFARRSLFVEDGDFSRAADALAEAATLRHRSTSAPSAVLVRDLAVSFALL